MVRCYSVMASTHNQPSRFLEYGLGRAILHKVARLLHQMIPHQSVDLHTRRRLVGQVEAASGFLNGKLLRQAVKRLDGTLPALHIHAGILHLVVEVGFGQYQKRKSNISTL